VQFISYTAVNNVPSSGRLGMSSSSRSYTADSGIPYDTPRLRHSQHTSHHHRSQ